MATFNHEVHAQAMAKKQFIIAGLIVDGLIQTGADLLKAQQAHPAYFAQKRIIEKTRVHDFQFRIELHDWKDRLMEKWNPEIEEEEKWEHGRNCDCDYCDNPGFSNAEMM